MFQGVAFVAGEIKWHGTLSYLVIMLNTIFLLP
jgi:hypothetical protein